ncbi:hypothetical protein DFH09DRAFT_659718 [Mycena vulgaris]|nr:hypothetical protein DFH09DRAFT_659718 [Mycena vulgaris]
MLFSAATPRARQHRRSPRSYTPPPPTSSPAPPPPFRHASAPARLRPALNSSPCSSFAARRLCHFDAGISLDGNCARAPAPHAGTPRARMRRHFPPSCATAASPSSPARPRPEPVPPLPALAYTATPHARMRRHSPPSCAAAVSPSSPSRPRPSPRRCGPDRLRRRRPCSSFPAVSVCHLDAEISLEGNWNISLQQLPWKETAGRNPLQFRAGILGGEFPAVLSLRFQSGVP